MFERIQVDPAVSQIVAELKKPNARLALHREGWGGLGPFLAVLRQALQSPILYIGKSEEKVRAIFGDASLFCQAARFFPKREPPPLEDSVASGERQAVLQELLTEKSPFIFTTVAAVLCPTRAPQHLKKQVIALTAGQVFPFEKFLKILEEWGYYRVDTVMGKKEFSVRGGIVDFFPGAAPFPYRLEWNGNAIDSIRSFDPASQRSIQKLESLNLFPPESEQDTTAFLMDYLSSKTLVIAEDPEQWQYPETFPAESVAGFLQWMKAQSSLSFTAVPKDNLMPWPFKPVPHFEHRFRDFLEAAREALNQGETLCIYTRQASRLRDVLLENHLPEVNVISSPLSEGFKIPSQRCSIYTDYELFGHVISSILPRAFKSSRPISLEELTEGDVVVHAHHGMARYDGLVPLTVEGKKEDFLALSFAGSDKLYVPLEEMHLVERYIGPKGDISSLSKLGGERWRNTRKRAQRAAQEIAQDLVRLYASRSQIAGHAFSPDTPWQAELEEAFPFQETLDQQKAIRAAKADMESPKPMDRLVLGDVGYGKTEVALRAAFKAMMDGKQVAVLAPTTILAQQHYETFYQRLATFPIRLEMLSRFKTPKEIRQILQGLRAGEVDLVIGTHRLLQGDVQFKSLGLLIVDEEQRFGVKHKEILKKLQTDVDVLTLSATPIPRTLHLSLVGLRDISVIATAPAERLPVKTFVVPKADSLIQRGIRQELERSGQVYYLYNHVEKIAAKAKAIQTLVPEARLAVAHGQMKAGALEEVMWKFMKGFYDVLLCTTIIENGLDIPRVNTLMVEEAHRYGLAQLYQLRGRVGRSDRQADAYFFLPPQGQVSETAQKRLNVLEELSRLGSGYQIAMKDLEIRGAGNLLGLAQSGRVADVGFHLYCKILEEEIKKLKGEKIAPPPPHVEINLPVAAFIPDEYIPSRAQKLDFYRRLAAVKKEEEVGEVLDELLDRFGDPPPEAVNLLEMVKLRLLCLKHHVQEIKLQEDEIKISYANGRESVEFPADKEDIFHAIREKGGIVILSEAKDLL